MDERSRSRVQFQSGRQQCVAHHYAGTNGACVVMGPGAGITKEPGTDRFAAEFHRAGYSVLAFDHRHWGESGGEPRHVLKVTTQLTDWRAAVGAAALLPEVDASRIAVWGFSLAGGHVIELAADPSLPIAAVISQTPFSDGWVLTPHVLRHETLGVLLRFPLIAALDALRGLLRLSPVLIPLSGPRGTIAMVTTPDAHAGGEALDPERRYTDWERTIAARSVLPLGFYRPSRSASRVSVPVLVVVATDDETNLARPALTMARAVQQGEVLAIPGPHYAPFLDQFDVVASAELDFLDGHLLAER